MFKYRISGKTCFSFVAQTSLESANAYASSLRSEELHAGSYYDTIGAGESTKHFCPVVSKICGGSVGPCWNSQDDFGATDQGEPLVGNWMRIDYES